MHTLKEMIATVLRERLYLDGKEVPVLTRYYPGDRTPCVTMDDSAGAPVVDKRHVTLSLPLPESHGQFDPECPGALHPQDCLAERKKGMVSVNVWCDDERQRQDISGMIRQLFHEAETHHYKFCARYDDGLCSSLGEECKAVEDVSARGVKNQCPHPRCYRYKGLFAQYRIVPHSFVVHEPFSRDELEEHPPVLRSIFEVEAGFTDYYTVGGNTIDDLDLGDIRYV